MNVVNAEVLRTPEDSNGTVVAPCGGVSRVAERYPRHPERSRWTRAKVHQRRIETRTIDRVDDHRCIVVSVRGWGTSTFQDHICGSGPVNCCRPRAGARGNRHSISRCSSVQGRLHIGRTAGRRRDRRGESTSGREGCHQNDNVRSTLHEMENAALGAVSLAG